MDNWSDIVPTIIKGPIKVYFKLICNELEKAFALKKEPKWLLVLVNKCDLFFDDKLLNAAQNYYHPEGDSEFSKILQKTMNHIGKQRLKCKSIPLCSFEEDFSWNQKTVKTQIGGEQNRKALMINFFNTVANF